MAGGVWAYYLTFIEPQYAIDPLLMVGTALTAFLGGKGTLWGPTIGALIVVPAQQYFAFRLGASDLYLVSYAAIFLVVILLLPRGVVPSLGQWIRGRQAKASVASATAPDPQQPAPAGAAR
jgi:branched-chain amino acid transport system permease protein